MIRKLRNAFGKIYEASLLSTEEIKARFEILNYGDIVEKAYEGWIEGSCSGIAQLNCETGKLISASYSQGSGDIEGAHYIDLYRIDQNWEPETDNALAELFNFFDYIIDAIKENFRIGLRDLNEMIKEEN